MIPSEKQVHEESLEIGDIENCIKEHSNNRTNISDALPILSEDQIDKESLEIGEIRNSIQRNSRHIPKFQFFTNAIWKASS